MNIEESWKGLEPPAKGFDHQELQKSMKRPPDDLIHKLNRQMGWKVFYIVLFMPLYGWAIVYFDEWVIRVLCSLILAVHAVGLWFFVRRWQEARRFRMDEEDSRATLRHYIHRIESALRTEENVGLILYPFAVATGIFVGVAIKKPLDVMMEESRLWWTLAVATVVVVPLAWWMARRMNQYAFGKHLNELHKRLAEWDGE